MDRLLSSLTAALLASGLWLAAARPAAADLSVVVTIKPLHSMVAQVMGNTGTPELLVKGAASAHTYALKPSDATRLSAADVVFRMSDAMEPFTAKVAKTLPKRVQVVTLQDTPGLKLYPRRTGATFDDDGHDHAGHDHNHDAVDGHAWLDPGNAKIMVDRIAQVLSAKAPANTAQFRANADAFKARLDRLATDLAADLKPIATRPYIVFHDALQYFERRFGLRVVGSISVSPETPPSAKRLSALRKRVGARGAACVFAEPQFDTRLVEAVIEGTPARMGRIDPEGAGIDPGPDLYVTLLTSLARDLKGCLAPPA
jgi:zinc transport system substrate-binding protein